MSNLWCKSSRKLAAAILFLLSISCTPKRSATSAQSTGSIAPALKAWHVSGIVTRTIPYCGGARPTEEIMAESQKPRPYPEQILHLIAGDHLIDNPDHLMSFQGDAEGKFSFDVPAGKYVILTDEQYKKKPISDFQKNRIKVDTTCFNDWMQKPFHAFEVKDADINDMKLHFTFRCFVDHYMPCLQYDGPLPP